MATVALATGCRRGELCALRWVDVDLDVGDFRIRAAISVAPDGTPVRKLTKGRRARTVRIDPATVGVLRRWPRESQEQALALGVPHRASMPVFPSPRDPRDVWHPDLITTAWDRHRKAIGLPTIRWHDLRHHHATTLLEEGIPVHVVSARLGHANPTVTLNIYADALPAGDAPAAEAIARAGSRQAT